MPKGYKNAVPAAELELSATESADAVTEQVDEAGNPLVAVSGDLSAGQEAKIAAGEQFAATLDGAQPETADEPQAPFELVDTIPSVRHPKTKYSDAAAFLRANPGQAIRIPLTGKTSAVGAAQTIRNNFPDISVATRTDPNTREVACYAVFNPAAPVDAPVA